VADLTREQMLDEIAQGRSILFNPTPAHPGGRQAVHAEHLPSEAELARKSGDVARMDAAEDAIDAQIAALQAARSALRAPAPPAPAGPAKVATTDHDASQQPPRPSASSAPAPAPAIAPAPAAKVEKK
jgi:hypothetical protein